MMVVWRDGKYKYRPAQIAYINNVRVGAVSWIANSEYYSSHCLLPGIKWLTNTYSSSAAGKEAVEANIQQWFEAVKQ